MTRTKGTRSGRLPCYWFPIDKDQTQLGEQNFTANFNHRNRSYCVLAQRFRPRNVASFVLRSTGWVLSNRSFFVIPIYFRYFFLLFFFFFTPFWVIITVTTTVTKITSEKVERIDITKSKWAIPLLRNAKYFSLYSLHIGKKFKNYVF